MAACSNDVTAIDRPPSVEVLAAAVTGKASLSVNADGKFANLQSSAPGELSPGEAVLLANAYAKQFVPLQYSFLEQRRGGKIDLKRLTACGRPLYAQSPFEPLPQTIDVIFRRAYSAWWLVTLCAGNDPQVSLAVSALATDLKIEKGKIVFPPIHGSEFFPAGIPVEHEGEFPMSPEAAAVRASKLSGVRVSSVPTLLMPSSAEGSPQEAKWTLALERSVRMRSASARVVETATIFAAAEIQKRGFAAAYDYLAAANQPPGETFQIPVMARVGESLEAYEARQRAEPPITGNARRQEGRPLKFERAEGRVEQ